MLLKLGVDISRLEYHCRKMLNAIDMVFTTQFSTEAVITSTYEGTHSAGSLHYQNRAMDFRYPTSDVEKRKLLITSLRELLGNEFDVIQELTHIHVEYDPK